MFLMARSREIGTPFSPEDRRQGATPRSRSLQSPIGSGVRAAESNGAQQHDAERPFVSVVVLTHQRRHLLKATLRSLFEQDYPADRYEVVVIVNGSTDGTVDYLRNLDDGAPCRFLWRYQEDLGPAAARNTGIRMATGSIIATTDDDCRADREWLSRGTQAFAPGVGLVQGRTLLDPEARWSFFSRSSQWESEDGHYSTCNMFYLRRALEEVGDFDESYGELRDLSGYPLGGEDVDCGWRVKGAGYTSRFVPEALIYHHVFHLSPRAWFLLATRYAIWPWLVRTHPELRHYLYLRYFYSHERAVFLLCVAGLAAAAAFHPLALALTLPYAALYIGPNRRWLEGKARPFKVLLYALWDAVALATLLYSSLRARRLVL